MYFHNILTKSGGKVLFNLKIRQSLMISRIFRLTSIHNNIISFTNKTPTNISTLYAPVVTLKCTPHNNILF